MKTIKEAGLRLSLLDNVTANALRVSTALQKLDKKLDGFIRKRDRPLADFQSAATQAAAIAAAVTLPTIKAAQFESSLEDVRQKINGTIEDVRRLNREIRKAGVLDGVGAQRAAQTTDALIGLGASDGDARAMSSPINRASVAYKADTGELAQAVYSSAGSFGISASQTAKALDILAESGKRGAVELKNQATILPSLSAQYGALGAKGLPALADLAAQLQVVRKGTGNAEEAATSLQNLYSSLTGPEAQKRLKENGIVLSDLQEKAASTGASLVDLLLDEIQRVTGGNAEKLGELFPDRESQRAIRPLMANRGELADIRAGSLAADGTVERDFESRMQTLEGKWQRLMAGVEEITLSLGDKLLPTAKDLVDTFIQAADRLDRFIDQNGELIVTVTKVTAALVGFRLATAGVRLAMWSMIIPAAQAVKAIGQMGMAAYAATMPMIGLQTALKGAALTRLETVAAGLRGLVLAVPGLGMLTSALAGIGAALAAVSAPVWLAIAAGVAAVAGAGAMLWKYWDRVSSVVSGVASRIGEELQPVLTKLESVLAPIGAAVNAVGEAFSWAGQKISDFAGWLGSLFQREVLNDSQKAAFSKAGYDVADAFINAFKAEVERLFELVKSIPGRIRDAIGRIDLSGIISWPALPSWMGGGGGDAPAATVPATVPVAGARAKGGPVRGGLPYLVGEKGPEIVVPGRSGTVIPNHHIGGGPITVAPVFHLSVQGHGAKDLEALARRAAEQVVSAVNGALSHQLNRSSQTAFGGTKPYGD
ncbi:phage tail tape measure protein, TP901 family [Rhizobium sp. PDO1-076]|uniref:phage tail tape measure protein n=1 Tax=Rhizobium sp. PDO1-076 TaxID=1125979 RepID=UPI00024E2D90|nr:phage tail tape measure protein [Rhizobium sp. PDO1-076]EHS49766.1 phage tail tape measure protein, TP901 family [Rhizobium sp. PDO1-076]